MATAIQFLRSSVPSLRPSPPSLSEGMPMVNFNASDPGLYLSLNDQSLMKVGPTHVNVTAPNYNGPGFGGNCKGEMWLDTTISTGVKPRAVLKTWDGFKWVDTGGSIRADELPQEPNTFLAGPVVGPANVPTFREMDFDDLPDSIPLTKLEGGKTPGSLIIGGSDGWGENPLGLGDDSLTATIGDNTLTLEVTAGNIAGLGPDGTIKSGDGHVQFNYDGVYSADNRFKFKKEANGILQAHTSTEFGENVSNHTHTFIGDISVTGDVTLEHVHSLTVGGDFFLGHNAQIGSDPLELLAVFSKTEFNSDVEIKDFNSLDVGGNAFVHRNTVLGEADTNVLTVAATSTFLSSMTVGRGCVSGDVFTANANSVFECDVQIKGDLNIEGGTSDFGGDVILGTDCNNYVKIQGVQLNNCDIYVGTNVPDANAQQLTIEADTGNLTTKGEVFVTEKLTVSNPLTATPPKFTVDGPTGDVDSEGTVTAKFFSGDGSQLFNLAVPNSMLFSGDINATIPGTVPGAAQPGDFWLNNTTGFVDAGWPDIGGQAIQQDQFIYYAQTSPTTFAWNLGSVQNNQGFVTINTNQDINGSKTFKAPSFFDEYIEVRDQKTTLLTGTLTVKQHTQLDDTLTVDDNQATLLGGTLTVKDDTELRGNLTVVDDKNTVLGNDLLVKGSTTLGSACTDLLIVNSSSTFLCGLEIGDSSNPCVGGTFDVYFPTNIACDTALAANFSVAGNTTLGTTCANTLTINSTTTINCATTIVGTFTVSGNNATTLGGSLTVEDNRATLLGGTLTVKGATALQSTLTVTSTTQLNNTLTVADSKATTLGGTLTVKGATALQSTLSVTGVTQLNNTLTVAGATTLNTTLTVLGNASVGGTLTVTGATSLSSTLTVTGNTQLNNSLTVADGKVTTLGGTLTVKAAATLQSTLAVTGTSTLSNTLTVAGATTLRSTLAVTSTTTLSNTLSVAGATTLSSTLAVTGTTTLSNTLAVSGATTLSSTLTVTGVTTLNSTLTVNSTTTTRTVRPNADNSQDLGATSLRYKNIYGVTHHGALSGNATTATTLQTARNINGTSFNGSANITTAQWGTARTITVGSTGKSINGSTNYAWSLAEIGVNNVGINFNAGTGLSQSGTNATTNQAGATTKTFSVNRGVVDTWYAPAGTVSAANGQINFNAGNGLSSSGANATANQSGNTTKTFSVKADGGSLTVGAAGIKVTAPAENGQINFNAGTGLTSTGTNATANQAGNTTKTFNVDKTYFDGLYAPVNSGVTKITAGTNVTISPTSGVGNVTINASGGAAITAGNGILDTSGVFSVQNSDSSIKVEAAGIKVDIVALPTR